jgi:hypothetical protein
MRKRASTIFLCFALAGCGAVEKSVEKAVATFVDPFTDFSKWETGDSSVDGATTRPTDKTPANASNPSRPSPRGEAIRPAAPEKIIQGQDPPQIVRPIVSLTIYRYVVPAGTLSADEEFWKRVDESAINVKTHDILDRNGMRVGLAPFVDWPKLSQRLIKLDPQSKPAIYTAAGTHNIEIPMKNEVRYQIIYHFTPDGRLPVRSYDDSSNILRLEFKPAPRKAGDVRIELCPMVRSLRKTILSTGEEIAFVSPEAFFDLSLLADVPLDSMLVIAPSSSAKESMSLGKAFFMGESETGQTETIVLLTPQALKPE